MDATGDTPEWYSAREVARRFGVSAQAIRNAAEDGRLTAWWREGTGGRAPYRFSKAEIDGLNGVLPRSRPRGRTLANDLELNELIGRLRGEAATARTERALADQRIVMLEWENERLRGALRDLVDRFTRPELPDVPSPG
jgi:transposase